MINRTDPGFNATDNPALSDSVDLPTPTRGIMIGGAGTLKVTMRGGNVVTFTGLVVGIFHPIQASRIWSTGTTATNIHAVW